MYRLGAKGRRFVLRGVIQLHHMWCVRASSGTTPLMDSSDQALSDINTYV